MFPDSPALRERDRLTAEAFADPKPGDRFQEMFSWWMIVIAADADGVKAMRGSGPTNLVRGRFPDGEIVEPFPERAEVRWYATADDFRDGFRYGSVFGYSMTLADRGLDVSGWLERAKSAPAAPTHPRPERAPASPPLTCEACRNSPATHLLVADLDAGKGLRVNQVTCKPCADFATGLRRPGDHLYLYRLTPERN